MPHVDEIHQHEPYLAKRQRWFSFFVLLVLLFVTGMVVLYGRGYRFGFNGDKPSLSKTGLLVTNSIPNGAEVYINDHLTTATDATTNLVPGEYIVKIHKEGYFPWSKKVIIQQEVVTKVESLLMPTTPKLESITSIGALDPLLDPSGTRIAYKVASQSARRNGIYVYDLNANTVLSLQGASRLIADDTVGLMSAAHLSWSPDGEQILATIGETEATQTHFLLNSRVINQTPQDITATILATRELWQAEKQEKEQARLKALKSSLRSIIAKHFTILEWSPDDFKILYVASVSGRLPNVITPRLIGIDTLHEDRDLKQGGVYMYDIKDDVNMKLLDSLPRPEDDQPLADDAVAEGELTPTPMPSYCLETSNACQVGIKWFPDSKHFLFVKENRINIMDIDGTNITTVYAGPFLENYVFPWPNGSKFVILTDLNNPDITPNLYTVSLK